MLNGFCNYTITKDLTENIKKSLEDLAKKKVLVGVPDTTQHPDSEVSNAQLLYIHTNGVRSKDMRAEMQHNQNENGMTYSVGNLQMLVSQVKKLESKKFDANSIQSSIERFYDKKYYSKLDKILNNINQK